MFHKKTGLLLLAFSLLRMMAQEYHYHYLVYLKDKPASGYSIADPSSFLSSKAIERRKKYHVAITVEDLPVDTNYISALRAVGDCKVWNKSKWLNAVEVRFTDQATLERILILPFVKTVMFLGKTAIKPLPEIPVVDRKFSDTLKKTAFAENIRLTQSDYGDAFVQNSLININALHNMQCRGEGISIAVFDAGFSNAYKTPGMHINTDDIVIRDFVSHDNSVWEDDRHGANVLSFMKTYNPGIYIGTAPMADYMLIRTEDAASEYPIEEVNWLVAAEFADSMGVDLISSSLGYNIFDDTSLSHHYRDLDGRSSIIAKAANMAHSKGIFIAVSAGNEGNNKWRRIGTPSDAPGVITIGATDSEGTHADFSSYGPTEDNRIKPDFVVMGKKAVVASSGGNYAGNGTSYATPVFAGALACLMQACPNKTYEEMVNALRQSSSHAGSPDSAYGYGIPDMRLAAAILGNYKGLDTLNDMLWDNPEGSYWQKQTLHFRSSKDQVIKIRISGKMRHKSKSISQHKVVMKKGEWLHSDELHHLIANQLGKPQKKRFREIRMEIETQNMTESRVFKLK